MSQYEIRNRAILPEVLAAFMSGEQTAVCPRCGSNDVEYVESDGGLEVGWQKNTMSCYECNTQWVESFVCTPQPEEIVIEQFAEEREYDDRGFSWQAKLSDEEIERIVDGILAER